MQRLTPQEIQFIKETGWTPTVQQCDEWYRTIFGVGIKLDTADPLYKQKQGQYDSECLTKAQILAEEKYGFRLSDLYRKCTSEYDYISLEYAASYLFYTFFTREQLVSTTEEQATEWLKSFQYYCGFRKWDGGNLFYVKEAIEVYDDQRKFYLEDNGEVWNLPSTHEWLSTHPDRIIE